MKNSPMMLSSIEPNKLFYPVAICSMRSNNESVCAMSRRMSVRVPSQQGIVLMFLSILNPKQLSQLILVFQEPISLRQL